MRWGAAATTVSTRIRGDHTLLPSRALSGASVCARVTDGVAQRASVDGPIVRQLRRGSPSGGREYEMRRAVKPLKEDVKRHRGAMCRGGEQTEKRSRVGGWGRRSRIRGACQDAGGALRGHYFFLKACTTHTHTHAPLRPLLFSSLMGGRPTVTSHGAARPPQRQSLKAESKV